MLNDRQADDHNHEYRYAMLPSSAVVWQHERHDAQVPHAHAKSSPHVYDTVAGLAAIRDADSM